MQRGKLFYLIIIIGATLLVVSGCGKKAIRSDPNYEGFWSGSDGATFYTIEIDANSKGTYIEQATTVITESGKVRIQNNQTLLKIGSKKLDLQQTPKVIEDDLNGDYRTMIVNDVTLFASD